MMIDEVELAHGRNRHIIEIVHRRSNGPEIDQLEIDDDEEKIQQQRVADRHENGQK